MFICTIRSCCFVTLLMFVNKIGCGRRYPCLRASATGWRSCSASDSVEQAGLELSEAPHPPPASQTPQHPETQTTTTTTIKMFQEQSEVVLYINLHPKSKLLNSSGFSTTAHVNSPCSGSLCCGWPGSAARWSQHCPAGGRAPPSGRATSTPSPWSQSWTSYNTHTHTTQHTTHTHFRDAQI